MAPEQLAVVSNAGRLAESSWHVVTWSDGNKKKISYVCQILRRSDLDDQVIVRSYVSVSGTFKQIFKKCPGVEEETVDPSQFTKDLKSLKS